MLRRLPVASWRASAAASRPTAALQPFFSASTRNISVLPWRRSQAPTPPLPVYFPRVTLASRLRRWRRPLGRATFTAAVYVVCAYLLLCAVFWPIGDWLEAEYDSLSESEKKKFDRLAADEEALIFFPFPFTTKKIDQPLYKGSDAEWKQFVEINKNRKVESQIRGELTAILRRLVSSSPDAVRVLGGKDFGTGRAWLDITYPNRPPPKHYVSGIIVSDTGIYWGDRPMDSWAAMTMDSALYPKAVAMTAWSFLSTLLKRHSQGISSAFGVNETPSPPEAKPKSAASGPAGNPAVSKAQGARSAPAADATKRPAAPAISPMQVARSFMSDAPSSSELESDPDTRAALQAASKTFSKTWRPTRSQPYRGCIGVDGIVEFHGKQASVALFVWGWYDPKAKSWVTIHVSVKNWRSHKQRPAR